MGERLEEFDRFQHWLALGVSHGWIYGAHCATHDVVPMTQEELDNYRIGADECIYATRILWRNDATKVEDFKLAED